MTKLTKKSNSSFFSIVIIALTVSIVLLSSRTSASDDGTFAFNIPDQELSAALIEFSRQSKITVIAPTTVTDGLGAEPVVGNFPPNKALEMLLAKSSLKVRQRKDGAFVILAGEDNTQEKKPDIKFLSSIGQGVQNDQRDTMLNELEEILVVSVRKRAETMQDVPISIHAYTGSALEQAGVDSFEDLAFLTPGLNTNSFSAGANVSPTIRGLTKLDVGGFDSNVGVFFDSVYMSNTALLDPGFLELERVEIAFGPQSALYGRNSFAGAINYIPRRPTDEFEAEVTTTVGSDDRFDTKFYVGGPLSDKIKGNIAASYSEFEGPLENNTGGNLGGWDEKQNVLGQVMVDLTDNFAFDAMYYGARFKTDDSPGYIIESVRANPNGILNNCGLNTASGSFAAYCGSLKAFGEVDHSPIATGLDRDMDMFSMKLLYDVGFADIRLQYGKIDTKIAGISDGSRFADIDAFASPASPRGAGIVVGTSLTQPFAGPVEDESIELIMTSNSPSDIQWLFGASKFESERTQNFITGSELDGPGVFGAFATLSENQFVDEFSVFGQLGIDIGKFEVSVEGRYTEEEVGGLNILTFLRPTPAPPRITDIDATTFYYFTPRVTLGYALDDDSLIYANWAQGTRSGGFNSSSIASELTFDIETNDTFEIGFKKTWLDSRIITNIAVYSIEWTDLQISTTSAAPPPPGRPQPLITDNVGGAENLGAEISIRAEVTENFNLAVGLAVNNAEFDTSEKDFSLRDLDPANTGVFGRDIREIDGNSLPRQSDTQLNVRADYHIANLFADYDGFIRLDYSYQSDQYVSQANLVTIEDYSLVNLRVGAENKQLSLTFWADNLLDEEYVASALANSSVGLSENGSRGSSVLLGNTRTFGATAKFSF